MPQFDRDAGAHDVALLLMPFGKRIRLDAKAQYKN
jgi:hypothetical protein